MIDIINTIVPVFLVILVGIAIRKLGYLPEAQIGHLNRLVYYVAIPAMIFRAIATASFETHFRSGLLLGTLIPVVVVFGTAIVLGLLLSFPRKEMGTFIQNSFHGNLGYIGFAVTFYFLGDEGLTRATLIAGFLMLMQNLLSVIGLQAFSGQKGTAAGIISSVRAVIGNPVVLSAIVGICFNLSEMPLPLIAERTLGIVAGMALPLALLVIGASLSFELVMNKLPLIVPSALLKLILLPGLSLIVFRILGLGADEFLPGFILLAAPSATVSYVMATELNGSPEQASAAVSLSTLFSSVTYLLWLSIIA
jgi:predicted permease